MWPKAELNRARHSTKIKRKKKSFSVETFQWNCVPFWIWNRSRNVVSAVPFLNFFLQIWFVLRLVIRESKQIHSSSVEWAGFDENYILWNNSQARTRARVKIFNGKKGKIVPYAIIKFWKTQTSGKKNNDTNISLSLLLLVFFFFRVLGLGFRCHAHWHRHEIHPFPSLIQTKTKQPNR